ncbi:MAG: hypothetical protein FWC95_08445 [Defluviitaleaceae bacterium]|nr:hypothetical protein [Defluviitaleaceae bacterium]
MRTYIKLLSSFLVLALLFIGIPSLVYAGGQPSLPPIPPCPIYGTGDRSIDPCEPYSDEK